MAFRSRRARQPVAAPLRRPRRPRWRGRRRRPSPCLREHNLVNGIADTDSDGHAITETTGSAWAEPAHDAAGNMTTMPQPQSPTDSFTAVYDAWNRLTALKDGADVVAEYQYDGLHRRIVQHVDTTGDGAADLTRHDYYSRDWQLLEQREGTTPETADPEQQYVWGLRYIDDLVLRDQDADGDGSFTVADERLYALQDGRFNVTALADHSGAVVERFAYTPYGEATVLDADFTVDNGGTDHDWRIRYAGYRHDAESGLYHVRFRMLHAQLGRWVQRDPLGYVDGNNLHRLGRSNPVRWLDPWGLDVELQSHEVAFDDHHLSIRIIPNNQEQWANHPNFTQNDDGQWFTTLGAGPSGSLPGFWGELVAAHNRNTDLETALNPNVDRIPLPSPLDSEGNPITEDEFIEELIEGMGNYDDDLPYEAYPEPDDDSYYPVQ